MDIDNVITGLARDCAPKVLPGDYTDIVTGLLMCGKCKTPKQTKIPFGDSSMTVGCCCQCAAAARDQRRDERAQLKLQALRESCLPKAECNMTFASSKDSRQLSMARKYVEGWNTMKDRGAGLLCWGPSGTGKTHAAACIANSLIDLGIPVGFLSIGSLLNQPYDKVSPTIEEMQNKPLLIIDDFGVERQSEYARQVVFQLIDARVNTHMPMIVTTNLSMKTIDLIDPREDKFLLDHQRIYDRITAACCPIEFCGPSYRTDIRKEMNHFMREFLAL